LSFKRIFSVLDGREKRQLAVVFFVLLVMGIVELAGVGAIGPFISVAANPASIHSNKYLLLAYDYFNFQSDSHFIVACGIAVIAALFVSNASLACINLIINYYAAKRQHSIAMRLLEKYLRQPYIFYLNTNTAELSKKLLDEIHFFVNGALLGALQMISAAVVAFFIVLLLIVLNPLLALLASLVLGLSYFFIFTTVRRFIFQKGEERSVQNTLKYKHINETFGGIKDIKILGKERVFINLFRGPSLKYAVNNAISEMAGDLPKFLIETIAISGIVLVILLMILSGASLDKFRPLLTVYAFGAYRLLPPLQKIYRAVSQIKYFTKIIEDLNHDYRGLPPGNPLPDADIPRLPFHDCLRLEHICFSYPRAERAVIGDLSLAIKLNTSAALVGPTGCGKTTLVDIILGLLEPQGGRITVDGEEITSSNVGNWRKNLGYVPQSIFLIDDTVRNNIAFGVAPGEIDDEAVAAAAKIANIHDFVTKELKEGYHTSIGEKGIRLSGGQRQRIGIARAVYHDPSVLILDEATSALDSLTENAIIDAINNLSNKKTIIMIAHRLTTVKYCDVIYLMDKGVITARGSYDELYATNGTFKKMADGGV
jgi:ABC-type multidrug transport system fused ATPase/permease subunit